MNKKAKGFMMPGFVLLLLAMDLLTHAQLTLSPQLRTRTEYRNGTGTLRPTTNDPSFFTSQRSRLTFNYKMNRVILQTSVQDIRVWGQDASTISNADGAKLGLHETWAEIILSNKKDTSFKSSVDYFAVKIGRQELLYDDSRLLGNLDWLQQARRHDAVVFKLQNKGWQTDLGFAFNQNTDGFNYNGTYYTPANVPLYVKDSKGFLVVTPTGMVPLMNGAGVSSKTGNPSLMNPPSTNGMNQAYKAMQYLYVTKTFKQTRLTGLILADQFGKYKLDSVQTSNVSSDPGYVYGRRFNQKGVNGRVTAGILVSTPLNKTRSFSLTGGFYYQAGKDKDGIDLNAYTSTLAIGLTKGKLYYLLGWDYVSGNDAFSASATNHRFDPLYGTPHKFWGTMDYFYVATGSPAGGLSDPYFKVKYGSANKRFSTGLDYHYFMLAKNMKDVNGNAVDKYLGSEFDLLAMYSLNKFTTVEWGFSLMTASKSMEYAKAITPGTSKLTATWSYLMINIRPEFLFK
ncbi:MAG: alginate export family protein [Chitinophagaceae bacterium]|nr:alginate export family protein [Chitinophagaceae bacterium]